MQPIWPSVSIVTPVYNEAANLPELIARLSTVLSPRVEKLQVVIVNDGSTDQTSEVLESLTASNESIIGIELSRNFGQQSALTAGLRAATGDYVVVMDADLQDQPEDIPSLLQSLDEGSEVAYAIRTKRRENLILRGSYKLFYRVLGSLSDVEIPLDAGDFCAFKRNVLNLLNGLPEHRRFIRGLRSWVGFKQVGVRVERGTRESGASKYTFKKLFGLAFDGLLAFSFVPLRLVMVVGVAISVLSMLLAAFYTFKKLSIGLNPPGFATLVVLICFFTGIQLLTLGVIGEYLGRVYEEVKRRPHYVVRRVIGKRDREIVERCLVE